MKQGEEIKAFVTAVHSFAESGTVKDFGSVTSDLHILKVVCNCRLFLNSRWYTLPMLIKLSLTKLASIQYVTSIRTFQKRKLNCDSIAFAIQMVHLFAAAVKFNTMSDSEQFWDVFNSGPLFWVTNVNSEKNR